MWECDKCDKCDKCGDVAMWRTCLPVRQIRQVWEIWNTGNADERMNWISRNGNLEIRLELSSLEKLILDFLRNIPQSGMLIRLYPKYLLNSRLQIPKPKHLCTSTLSAMHGLI
jgi:hypothetical protein